MVLETISKFTIILKMKLYITESKIIKSRDSTDRVKCQ